MLHLIREESLERVIADDPDHERISGRNIELIKGLGQDKMQALLQSCFHESQK